MSTPRFLELPPGVRRVDVATPLGRIATLEAVPAAGGCERQSAVLVPGFTGSKEDFLAILQTLAQAGRRVHAIDLPGQYESPGTGDPADYTCEALGHAVAALVRALGEDGVHLLGHSFGGLVTREVVLSGEITPLSHTLMSSGPSGVGGASADNARGLMAALGPTPTAELLTEIWRQHLDGPTRASGISEEIADFLRARMLGNCPVGLVRMADGVTTAPDRTAELAEAPLPQLVLYGEDDDVWPPEAQAAMAKRLRAERVVIPGAAHSPGVEAPETTASALTDFWNRAEAPRRP
ncbi:alpha/beta fold hydrolase [Marinactinospora rubrisoli]|uniref:Alpha/beta fold hydrolase n=1 Tax=Marinactinospora rubrisoli TaxID=2715399 RepID=A0ABW2KDR4_9ACTN